MTKENTGEATVVSVSRRYVTLRLNDGSEHRGISSFQSLETVVGDRVTYSENEGSYFVKEILPRSNFLRRTYGKATKRIGSNLDRLFVVTAVAPLFNTIFIDRVLTAAFYEDIECTILLNKTDLGVDDTEALIQIYENLNIDVVRLSAKTGDGLDPLREILTDNELKIVSLCGVSGVGKSTILNALLPEVNLRTNEVSHKTGQGRQTTTQSFAYPYKREGDELLIVDLPGVQNFGISHLDKVDVALAMPDLKEASSGCEYHDCLHIAEPVCGVKSALDEGLMAESRYLSYLDMLDEIESMKEY